MLHLRPPQRYALRSALWALFVVFFTCISPASAASNLEIVYRVTFTQGESKARVEIDLTGKKLPRQLLLRFKPERHTFVSAEGNTESTAEGVIWIPEGDGAKLVYDFEVNAQKSSGSYDSRMTDSWAILRSDKLIPPITARLRGGTESSAVMELALPAKWSSALPYEKVGDQRFRIVDPGRQFKRPKGWMIVGEIGTRQDVIAGTDAKVSAPLKADFRRQDMLAFLNWTLPEVRQIFPDFPTYLLIVSAGDPMWRGGLSGTRSLFMHADRPLISGNRTSSLIHELIHVATGIHGDPESDWIVEGLAEFYAVDILRRAGGMSERRYQETFKKLATWGKEADSLLERRSSGPITARAAVLMYEIDQYIRSETNNLRSLDNVARALAEKRGKVTVKRFRALVEQAAGKPVPLLNRERLKVPIE